MFQIDEDIPRAKATTAKLEPHKLELIKAYIKGAVYCFCKNCPDENGGSLPFTASTLFGGENYYWECTPLFDLYDWHVQNNSGNAFNNAGIDLGHLLKKVIQTDERRRFTVTKVGRDTNQYRWTGSDQYGK